MSYKILQLMPAAGWCAIYEDDDAGSDLREAVACFALIEEEHPDLGPYQSMVPMVPDGRYFTRADEACNFLETRYIPDFKPEI